MFLVTQCDAHGVLIDVHLFYGDFYATCETYGSDHTWKSIETTISSKKPFSSDDILNVVPNPDITHFKIPLWVNVVSVLVRGFVYGCTSNRDTKPI